MPERRCDLAIIGGGIVGLAAGMELLTRHPSLRLLVLEKEDRIAQHQTGHNSGVLHSGIYYAPGSLKAKACVAGKAKLLRFCEEHGITYDLCGKVIVATDEEELPRLENLYQRGLANGVPGLTMIGPERLREIEPGAVGIKALHSPQTGIIDYTRVADAYADEIRQRGGEILTGHEVTAIEERGGRSELTTPAGAVEAHHVISCAGLYADRVAALTGAPATPQIVPFRGDYYVLRPQLAELVRGMIYPVPDPRFPFLGVHFTRRLNGEVWLGPNAVLAFAREGYGRFDVDPGELVETLRYPGFQALAAKFWRTGLDEMYRDYNKAAFLKALQRYMPDLTMDDLLPGPSGVRAQALAPDGALVDDFVVNHDGNALHVRNAPSPAATSSLAIAALIADTADEAFLLQ
ncbi:MAG TPA: L-2-hydroxyglutarate oxidase [Thermomicrobiales bacterium]|nr:L-2-hydroxyglutarate oxidase [Thermomicrobiales bacterium]